MTLTTGRIPWSKSQAKRVCDELFSGDVLALIQHAKAYVQGRKVRELGARFRSIVNQQNRRKWWERALRYAEAEYSSRSVTASLPSLPSWTENSGGAEAWKRWAERRARSCVRRAKRYIEAKGTSSLPSYNDWLSAIREALHRSDGRGQYSRFPLSLHHAPTHSMYPSIDHVVDPVIVNVSLEVRVVNDLKTILSVQELMKLIGHLSLVNRVPLLLLEDDWKPARNFVRALRSTEPAF